jgi:hypothetical protein
MNDYLRGYIAGYMEKLAEGKDNKEKEGILDYLKGKTNSAINYIDSLSDAAKYSLMAGGGALTGAGIGALVGPKDKRIRNALIGAGSGVLVGPAALYIARRIREYTNKPEGKKS